MAECLPAENTGAGTPGWFSAQGMFGLMFLKSCLNLSDEKRIERFNTDWTLQLLCGKLLEDNQKIKDKAIVRRISTCIGEHADWQQLQGVLSKHWKPDMDNTHVLLMDTTCHESYIRFPTDVKLLWESFRSLKNNFTSGAIYSARSVPDLDMWIKKGSNETMTASAERLASKDKRENALCCTC